MVKTFKIVKRKDNTWTGAGVFEEDDFTSAMDKLINAPSIDTEGMKIERVDYSFVNENIQHGEASFNVERTVYFIAVVHYIKT